MNLFMPFRLTSPQLAALDKFCAAHDDKWQITGVDNGTLEVRVSVGGYNDFTRYIDPAGNITRFDEDHDTDENATENPETGTYTEHGPDNMSRIRTYYY